MGDVRVPSARRHRIRRRSRVWRCPRLGRHLRCRGAVRDPQRRVVLPTEAPHGTNIPPFVVLRPDKASAAAGTPSAPDYRAPRCRVEARATLGSRRRSVPVLARKGALGRVCVGPSQSVVQADGAVRGRSRISKSASVGIATGPMAQNYANWAASARAQPTAAALRRSRPPSTRCPLTSDAERQRCADGGSDEEEPPRRAGVFVVVLAYQSRHAMLRCDAERLGQRRHDQRGRREVAAPVRVHRTA